MRRAGREFSILELRRAPARYAGRRETPAALIFPGAHEPSAHFTPM
jgi:hypothetical protein